MKSTMGENEIITSREFDFPRVRVFEAWTNPDSHEFQLTATFEELGDRTRVIFRQLFMKAAEFEEAKQYCVVANEQNLDRLNAVLEE
ncbi:hypothetical protein PAEVO_20510 [Paenibacillus sp. GM2FR]|uniref:SRPBCC domain-containing protein n=1 Tax=unclassified Paenibacillus TaxID=185978 RepID=UPI000CA749B3|nr:SRPBCC domain-containing protein [Paenibacillus sp. GM2FR]PJN55330.1 hypothetical protein PAEVO_20510 [Paenibacillus sp. GM2FR]